MFSYLRSHHRRTGSTPSSPEPPPLPPPKDLADATAPPIPSPDFFAYRHFGEDGPAQAQYAYGARGGGDSGSIHSPISNSDATPVSPFPPILPPITRVTSVRGRRRQTSPEKGRPERLSEEREYTTHGRHAKRRSEESIESHGWREDTRIASSQELPSRQQDQMRTFQSMERPKISKRPHTSQGPTGLRSRGQSVQANSNGGSGFRAFSSTTSPVHEHAPSFSEYASIPRPPVYSHSGGALASSGFHSISYDDARSNTPPIKHNAPAKPPTPPPPIMPNQKSKPKLNLRNPMSLLLRRRESHALDPLQLGDEATLLGLHRSNLPDDYDPRIIGKGVHDFSAPRPPPRKVYTTPNMNGSGESGGLRPPSAEDESEERGRSQSPYRHKRAHTPTFVEHFDEENTSTEKNVRAEELANKDFVTRNSASPMDQDKALPLPPFAKRASAQAPVLSVVPETSPSTSTAEGDPKVGEEAPKDTPSRAPSGPPRLTPNKENENPLGSITATPENMIKAAKATATGPSSLAPISPPKRRSRKSALGLPAHFDSSASRFSFQWGGPDSHLQEKLLEERHKAKQAQAAMAAKMRQDEEDWVEDDDYDDLDDNNYDDDGFDDGFSMPEGLGGGLSNSILASSTLDPPKMKDDNPLGAQDIIEAQRMALRSNPPSPADYSPASLDSRSLRAPSVASGRPSVDVRPSFERQGSSLSISRSAEREARTGSTSEGTNGDVDSTRLDVSHDQSATRSSPLAATRAQALDDDLYFDDGLIEDPGDEDDTANFDESQFDDPSHPLYERRPVSQAPTNLQAQQQSGMPQSQRASVEQMSDVSEQQRVTSLQSNARPFSGFSEQYGHSSRKSHMSDFDNLDAYHGALASATAQAFAAGRFERKDSVDIAGGDALMDKDGNVQRRSADSSLTSEADRSSKPSALDSSAHSTAQDENRSSQSTAFSPTQPQGPFSDDTSSTSPRNAFSAYNGLRIDSTGPGFEFEPESYTFGIDCDFDGIDENDPMIAAANAEALANDDEGEYGREFGFYAAPPPSAGLPNGNYMRKEDDDIPDSSDDGSDAGYSNGGYFGPKGIDLVGRQKSIREPNLTPITERSEYSTRNSCISLFGLPSSAVTSQQGLALAPISPVPPGSSGPAPSPGLAQLARLSPFGWEEDEMSLEKLMKLRRGAWGEGGNRNSMSDSGSVASGSSPRNSSPVGPPSAPHVLPKTHLQPVSPNSPGAGAPAMGWLNGVGVGVGIESVDGLARLGEDDESSSDEDVEGEQDSDYDTDGVLDDRVYDDEDSPMPDSPTITAADSASVRGSSPITAPMMDLPSVEQMQAQYQHQFQHPGPFFATPNNHPPSPPNAAFDPQSPMSPGSTTSPTTAMRHTANLNKSLPQLPSSPSPMPRPNPSMPHSPAHSRNNSANEGVTVTYVKEKDDSVEGGVRWVLERRRTELSGEVTVLGREVITGGRI